MDKNFVNGFFKAKSTTLYKKNDYDLLMSTSKEELFNALRLKGYGENIDIKSIDEIIALEFKKLVHDFKQSELDNLLFMLNLDDDLTNLILVYKEKLYNIKGKHHFIYNKTYSYDYLHRAIIEEDYGFLDGKEADFFRSLNKITKDLKPNELSSLVIKSYYQKIFLRFKKIDSSVVKYFKLKITMTNILTFLRVKYLKLNEKFLERNLINYGEIEISDFLELFNKEEEVIANRFSNHYLGKDNGAFRQFFEDNNIKSIEDKLYLVFTQDVVDFEYDDSGLGPVLAYMIRKNNEFRNIRTIYYSVGDASDKLILI